MPTQRGEHPDLAEQRVHRAVPEQVHVIAAVRPRDHPGYQVGSLTSASTSARTARPDLLRHQLGQPSPLRQRHHRDQAHQQHQMRVIKGCVRRARLCSNRA